VETEVWEKEKMEGNRPELYYEDLILKEQDPKKLGLSGTEEPGKKIWRGAKKQEEGFKGPKGPLLENGGSRGFKRAKRGWKTPYVRIRI